MKHYFIKFGYFKKVSWVAVHINNKYFVNVFMKYDIINLKWYIIIIYYDYYKLYKHLQYLTDEFIINKTI